MKIAHVINPVKVGEDRDLHFQQPVTFRSMRNAKRFAKCIVDLEIQFIETAYPEDQSVVNCTDFIKTAPLSGEIANYGTFDKPRKLPLFQEIIDKLYKAAPEADYYIQTNADIGVLPHFYVLIYDMVKDGCEAFCINKRILPEKLPDGTLMQDCPLSLMYSSCGNLHAGHDCFVFPHHLVPELDLGTICMGTPWSETTMITNLVAHAKNFTVFKEMHATFHIGDRRIWRPPEYNDYREHNTNEFARILRILSNKNKVILKHETIKYLIKKLKIEMDHNPNGCYSENCKYFASK